MKNALQQYLLDKQTNFKEKHDFLNSKSVIVNTHNTYDRLLQFTTIENISESNPIINCCNGFVVDVDTPDFKTIVATPNLIFRNTKLFGKKLKYEEKIDGTTVHLWYYENRWNVSTKYDMNDEQIEKLFFKYFHKKYMDLLDKCYTYTFELCSPFTNKIVNYKTIKIYFITAINNNTLEEVQLKEFKHFLPNTYKFKSIEEAIEFTNNQDPRKFEGLIVSDTKNNKIKIKNKQFLNLQTFKNSFDFRKIVILALTGDDYNISEFPEIVDTYTKTKSLINDICSKYDKIYELAKKTTTNKKDFITEVSKHTKFTTPLFEMYNKKIKNMHEYIVNMNPDKLILMMENGEI